MKLVLIAALAIAVAAPAFAGGNPDVAGYISFDPAGGDSSAVNPDPYATVNAYICLTALEQGMTSVSFRVTDVMTVCPGSFAPPSFVNLLPGDLAIGNVFTGVTLASTECMPPPTVVVGYVSLFYLGGSCCVELLDHPTYPRWVTDCSGLEPEGIDFYCVRSHGSIGGAECPPQDCESAASAQTWGEIKALYK